MSDEAPTNPEAPPAPAPTMNATATAPAAAVTFTAEQQERVNAIVAQRLAEDRARRQPSAAPAAPAAPPPPAPAADDEHMTPRQLRAALEEMRMRSVFDRMAAKHGIEGPAAEDVFSLFLIQKPANHTEWFETKSTQFGFKGTQQPAAPTVATQVTTPVVPTPSGPPISDKGSPAPGSVTNWEREFAENPIGMSPAAIALMDAKHGVEKGRRMRVEAGLRQGANIRVVAKP